MLDAAAVEVAMGVTVAGLGVFVAVAGGIYRVLVGSGGRVGEGVRVGRGVQVGLGVRVSSRVAVNIGWLMGVKVGTSASALAVFVAGTDFVAGTVSAAVCSGVLVKTTATGTSAVGTSVGTCPCSLLALLKEKTANSAPMASKTLAISMIMSHKGKPPKIPSLPLELTSPAMTITPRN